jgi:histidinol dehydrogenase
MKTLNNPSKALWSDLIKRPSLKKTTLRETVETVFRDVERNGDSAVLKYASLFDDLKGEKLRVSSEAISAAKDKLAPELMDAIVKAEQNIKKFHQSQTINSTRVETSSGVVCWQETRSIDRVGLYIPGGTAPLFSTLLMLGVPAKLAGCDKIVICTPASSESEISPAILYTAWYLGIDEIYMLGGMQAIAAMTYGTNQIPQVDKIFGPGNQFVTAAKQYALQQGVAIDMPAGPSEVLIMADDIANPAYVAADLLAQAEHGGDSQVVLLCESDAFAERVKLELNSQKENLTRKNVIDKALENTLMIAFDKVEDQIAFSNSYAPEHLIINMENTAEILPRIQSAGSVFIGAYSPESVGDYASGTNHTLPTNGAARAYSGVNLQSFQKTISFQELSYEGIQKLGPSVMVMADAEGLDAHKNAVEIRLSNNGN